MSPLSPEQKHKGLEEGPEVIVLSDLELILITIFILHINADVAKHLENRSVMIRSRHALSGSRETPLNPTAASPNGVSQTHPSLRTVALLGRALGTLGVGTHLHPDDGVDKEKHGNQQTDIGQGLVGRKAVKESAGDGDGVGGSYPHHFPPLSPRSAPRGWGVPGCAREVPGPGGPL